MRQLRFMDIAKVAEIFSIINRFFNAQGQFIVPFQHVSSGVS
ncbi:hypothetical protein [Rhizobium rhizoryzae]|uniref:Uncharacterized protein n=1 Tax=Rhizobium rhizoryzae TaxID=451876 RepID=A0A7W6LKT3_9HYPH|nr:hypothetical protein [Rhizobium rhizoryzae]MBB4146178.1 hypothetical protein [Rhizobium rhizoryzae]